MIRYPSFAPNAPAPCDVLRGTTLSDWMTLSSSYALFQHHASTQGQRPALTHIEQGSLDEVPKRCTYEEFRALVARSANVLASNGARRGGAVGLLVPNLYEQQFLFWGAQAVSAVLPLNFLLDPEHIAGLLVAADAKVLVALGPVPNSDIWKKALAVKEIAGDQIECIIQVGGEPDRRPGVVQYSECMAHAADQLAPELLPKPDDTAALFHTGGTTGLPKLVRHTHWNELAAAYAFVSASEITSDDVSANGFPMFHVAGAILFSLGTYMAGAHLINLSAAGFRNPAMVKNHWQVIERYRITTTGAVPTALSSVATVPVQPYDISSLRRAFSGGSMVPRTVAQRFESVTGVALREVYGMTETCGIICIEPLRSERLLSSAGFAAPFINVAVRELLPNGDLGARVEHGAAGVLVVRGDSVTPGYKDPQHNQSAFTADGWLISGDLATQSADGRVTLFGRSKDLIIRSGHNIDPQVIEDAAMQHPDVVSAAAVGEPDQYAGELPVCYVVLRPKAKATLGELTEYIAARVPERPARPKHVYAIDAIPVTGVGKIFKPALRRDAVGKVVARQIEGLPILHVDVRDGKGGALAVTLTSKADAERKTLNSELEKRLVDFQFSWRLVVQGKA